MGEVGFLQFRDYINRVDVGKVVNLVEEYFEGKMEGKMQPQ